MDSMLQDVTRYGTAARAAKLGRKDLAGKTGTTNDFLDAWFCGYSPALVGVAWMGFDQPRTLGRNETGGAVSLPIWIGYMDKALKGIPEVARTAPEGVVHYKVDNEGSGGHQEFFYKESLPPPPPPPERAPERQFERLPDRPGAPAPGETPEFKPAPSVGRIEERPLESVPAPLPIERPRREG
jgi:penicillin-binding protein 1A